MGEYAIRESDDAEIKIGTCEDMLYLRYEDRHKVRKVSNSLDPADPALIGVLRFRLPFPDEDDILPGDYQDWERGQRLYKARAGSLPSEEFSDPSKIEEPGIMQLHHQKSGLLLNVPCYHGEKLPEVAAPMKAFWNGKGHSFELYQLKPMPDGIVYPVIHCRHCKMAWRYKWAAVWEYVPQDMRPALRPYAEVALAA